MKQQDLLRDPQEVEFALWEGCEQVETRKVTGGGAGQAENQRP